MKAFLMGCEGENIFKWKQFCLSGNLALKWKQGLCLRCHGNWRETAKFNNGIKMSLMSG